MRGGGGFVLGGMRGGFEGGGGGDGLCVGEVGEVG